MNKILPKNEVESLLVSHFPALKELFEESLVDLNKALTVLPEKTNNLSKCILLHSLITEKLKRHFSDIPGIHIKEKYNSIQIIFDKKVVARVKKVNSKNISSNAKTIRNNAILSHQLSLFPGMDLTFIDLGYEIDETWDSFKRLVAVCRENQLVRWHIDYTTIGENITHFNTKPEEVLNVKEGVEIRIKKTK